jgi:hypothetical protein
MTVVGKSTANIEYIISECDFSIQPNDNYYLNLGGFDCEFRFDNNGEMAQQYVGASGLINVPKNIEVSQVILKISNGQTVNTTFYPQLEYGESFTSYESYKCKTCEIDMGNYASFLPSNSLYPSDSLFPSEENVIDYVLIENGSISISVNGIPRLLKSGAVGLFSDYTTLYANKYLFMVLEYSTNLIDVNSLEFLQGKATTTNQFKILKDGSIEAHNGYFSGRIEADSGYFKGEISWGQITGNEGVATKDFVEGKGYQNEIQVTKITKDTVTAPFIKTLGLTVGNEILMGENAYISWDKVTNQPRIPTDTSHLTNGAGYQNSSQVTTITKNTVTTSFVNALKVKAGSVDAENITGTTITGKVLKGVTGEFSGKITASSGTIGGFAIGSRSLHAGLKTSLSSNLSGVYVGEDGISVGGYAFKVTSDGDIFLGYENNINTKGCINFQASQYAKIKYDNSELMAFSQYKTTFSKDVEVSNHNLTIKGGDIILPDATNYIRGGTATNYKIKFETSRVSLVSPCSVVGASDSKVGFFGNDGSSKKTVSTITSASSATASTIATKLNELINALKAYNLV